MSKLTDLLNQITAWIQEYNPEQWHQINLAPGLSLDRIQSYAEGKSFKFPQEILELYQWQEGRGHGSFFLSATGGYNEQEFYDLAYGLGVGEEWEQDYCPGKPLLALFAVEDNYYWTALPDTDREFAPIYASGDEPDFEFATPTYASLTEMLEQEVTQMKSAWNID